MAPDRQVRQASAEGVPLWQSWPQAPQTPALRTPPPRSSVQTPGQTADHMLTRIENPTSQTENEILGQQLPLRCSLRYPRGVGPHPEVLEGHEEQIQKQALKPRKQKTGGTVLSICDLVVCFKLWYGLLVDWVVPGKKSHWISVFFWNWQDNKMLDVGRG